MEQQPFSSLPHVQKLAKLEQKTAELDSSPLAYVWSRNRHFFCRAGVKCEERAAGSDLGGHLETVRFRTLLGSMVLSRPPCWRSVLTACDCQVYLKLSSGVREAMTPHIPRLRHTFRAPPGSRSRGLFGSGPCCHPTACIRSVKLELRS